MAAIALETSAFSHEWSPTGCGDRTAQNQPDDNAFTCLWYAHDENDDADAQHRHGRKPSSPIMMAVFIIEADTISPPLPMSLSPVTKTIRAA